MPIDRDNLADFFRIQQLGFEKCLEPGMQCRQPAIRAHSIQNRRIITLLQENNHVLAWQPRFSVDHLDIGLRTVGRNDASTFTGFCNHHDTELFKPLDTKPLDVGDREQLFLLAYRGITCELHAIMSFVVKLQYLYETRKRRGVDPGDASSPAGQMATQQMLLAWATWRYRNTYYDTPLLTSSSSNIEHDIIILDDQKPCLAASSFFTLKDAPIDDELIGVAINVLPVSENKTAAILSYSQKDRGQARAAMDRVLQSTGAMQRYELSKLILSRISNVLISPRQFRMWSHAKQRKITDAFVQSAREYSDVADDADLMLF